MTFRTLFLAGIFLLGVAVVPAGAAQAVTCTPACAANQVCVENLSGKSECIAKAVCTGSGCTVEEVTVTGGSPGKSFRQIVEGPVTDLGNLVIELLYAVAFFFFLWGVFKFFFAKGEKGREEGKQYIVWGLVGLAVLFAVWGLVQLFISTLSTWGGV